MVKIDANEIYKKLNDYVKNFIDGDLTKKREIGEQICSVIDNIIPKINDVVKKNNVEEIV